MEGHTKHVYTGTCIRAEDSFNGRPHQTRLYTGTSIQAADSFNGKTHQTHLSIRAHAYELKTVLMEGHTKHVYTGTCILLRAFSTIEFYSFFYHRLKNLK